MLASRESGAFISRPYDPPRTPWQNRAPTGSEAFGCEDELELLGSLATLAGLWVTAFAVVWVFYWPLFRWHRNLTWNPGPRRH
ncbi:MAG TPA: hypothetical protein VNO76_07600 [Thermoplasmata archaeon]|nr:hypothetical protein [Thermoplasmata archaeon]